ncbi:MAG: ECF transporter S component, partial [Candidatus Sumerlaeaceae bacterium]|nr:ECF transporter S component [Candidatus Sumerlaeaceae bacterium]
MNEPNSNQPIPLGEPPRFKVHPITILLFVIAVILFALAGFKGLLQHHSTFVAYLASSFFGALIAGLIMGWAARRVARNSSAVGNIAFCLVFAAATGNVLVPIYLSPTGYMRRDTSANRATGDALASTVKKVNTMRERAVADYRTSGTANTTLLDDMEAAYEKAAAESKSKDDADVARLLVDLTRMMKVAVQPVTSATGELAAAGGLDVTSATRENLAMRVKLFGEFKAANEKCLADILAIPDALAKRAESLGVGRDATERRQFVNLLSANLYIPLQKTHRKAAAEFADAAMTYFSFLESHFGTWHVDEAA